MSLRAIRGSDRSTFKGKRRIIESSCSNTFAPMYFFCHLSRDLAEEDEDVFCVCKSSTGDRTFQT